MYRHLYCILILLLFKACVGSLCAQETSARLDELDSLFNVYKKKGNYDKALPYIQEALVLSKETFGERDSAYAHHLSALGNLYFELGDYAKCEVLFEEVLDIYAEVYGKKALKNAYVLNDMASLYLTLGQFSKASKRFEQSIEILEQHIDLQSIDFASALMNLGVCYKYMGDLEKAEPIYERVVQIFSINHKSHPVYATIISNFADLNANLGKLDRSELLMLEALEIEKKQSGEKHPQYGIRLNNLASLYKKKGSYDQAIALYAECKAIWKESLGKQHPYYITVLSNLASLYLEIGELKKAERMYMQTMKIRANSLGEEHPKYAISLESLAKIYQETKRYEDAEAYLQQALQIRSKAQGNEHYDYASTLSTLGGLYVELNEYKKAESYYLQAQKILLKQFGGEYEATIRGYNRMAKLYAQWGKEDRFWNCLETSLKYNSSITKSSKFNKKWKQAILKQALVSRKEMIVSLEIIYNRFQTKNDVQSIVQQQTTADLALQLLGRSRQDYNSEKDQLRILSTISDWTILALKSTERLRNTTYWELARKKAFEFSELSKSILLMGAIQNNKAYSVGDLPDSLVIKERKIKRSIAKLKAKLQEPQTEVKRKKLRHELNDLNLELNQLTEYIAKEFPKYSKLKYRNYQIDIDAIQETLDEETAILSYTLSDSIVYLFYIDKRTIDFLVLDMPAQELKEKIALLRKELSNYEAIVQEPEKAYRKYTTLAHHLYKVLLEDVLKSRDAIQKLVIIPDGELSQIPFELFLEQPASETLNYHQLAYLLNHYTLSYAYSIALWEENKKDKKPQVNGDMLGVAAMYPNLDSNKENLFAQVGSPNAHYDLMRKELSPLPNARKEVEALEKIFQGTFVFDTLANEGFFKRSAENFGILHLAMHGIFNPHSPMLSSLAFTATDGEIENDFLQAYEISSMELKASLAILSACETGYGAIEKGNGVASLARSFMFAGVPSLVVSMWQVNDQSTSFIMEALYNNIAQGMSKDKALSEAKLSYIQESEDLMAHPAFWAPFIQIGDSDPILLNKKAANSSYIWFVLLGIGLVVIYFIWRRK